MAEEYLDEYQRDDLKKGLYAYLQDKAKRRAETGNSKAYEAMQKNFQKQEALYDLGALAGGLSEAASMVGTVGGKRAESDIIPQVNQALYNSAQNRMNNMAQMRRLEQESNRDDLDTARYLTGLEQYDDRFKASQKMQESQLQTAELQRERLRRDLLSRYKLDPRVKSKTGAPVMLDEQGGYKELPDLRLNENAIQREGSWSPVQGMQGPDGVILERNNKTGEIRERALPKGWNPKKSPEPEDKASADVAKNFEMDYAKKSQIASVIERELETFDRLAKSGDIDAAVRHGEGTLKALNSAFGADAVGKEESERLGGFLKRFKMPWEPGSTFNYDLDRFSKQLRDKADVLKRSASDSLQRSKAARSGGLEALGSIKSAPMSPSDVDQMSDEEVDAELKKRGLIRQQ